MVSDKEFGGCCAVVPTSENPLLVEVIDVPHCVRASLAPLCCSLLWLLIAVPSQALEKVTLQLKWQHSFQFAGYYAAQQQGFYQAAGLDVELVPLTPPQDVVAQVLSQQAQFGVGTSSLLLNFAKGAPVLLVANVYQHSALVLLSRQLNPLQDIHDLRGRRLMLEPGADELRAYLKFQGIAPNDYQELPYSYQLQDLIDGRVDAISAYSIAEPVQLHQANVAFHLYTPRAFGIDFYGDNLFTSQAYAKKKPDVVQAFRRASMQGWVYAMSHVDEVIAYMQQQGLSRADTVTLQAEAQALQPLLRLDLIEPGYINSARWQHIADVYQQLGVLDTMPELTEFLPTQAKPIGRIWYLLAGVVAVGLVVTLVLLGYITRVNRRLNKVLAEARRQRQWQYSRSQLLQLMLQHGLDQASLALQVLALLKQSQLDLRAVLLLDKAPDQPKFFSLDLTAAGEHELMARLAGFHDECDVPGLNLLRVPVLGQPLPEFSHALAGDPHFCAFPLQSDRGQIPGVLLVWQSAEFNRQDLELLDDWVSITAIGLERLATAQALRQSEARHRLLTDHASDVIWTLDEQGKISYISPAVERLRGFTQREVMNQHITQAMSAESAAKVQAALQHSLEQVAKGLPFPEFVAELQQPHKNGGMLWVEVKTAGIYNERNEFIGVVGITRDLTERKAAEHQIRHLAQHDSLTGLPNRLLFHDRLAQALHFCSRHERQLAVLLLDLNKFKPVNDQYGHGAGDALLIAIGERLRQLLRASDTVARIGGDEFVVLIPQLEQAQEADQVAAKIRTALSQPFALPMATVNIGCSIGIARFPDDGDDEDQLLHIADVRMYQQKQAERTPAR